MQVGQPIDTSQECTTRIIFEKSLQQTKFDPFINQTNDPFNVDQVEGQERRWVKNDEQKIIYWETT